MWTVLFPRISIFSNVFCTVRRSYMESSADTISMVFHSYNNYILNCGNFVRSGPKTNLRIHDVVISEQYIEINDFDHICIITKKALSYVDNNNNIYTSVNLRCPPLRPRVIGPRFLISFSEIKFSNAGKKKKKTASLSLSRFRPPLLHT